MNAEDKAEYHNSLVKNISRKCHEKCFKSDEMKLDKNCLTGCYHKYINVMSKLRKLSLQKGEKLESQFVISAFSLKQDAHMDLIWMPGGSKYMYGVPYNWVLKYVLFHNLTPYKGFSPYRDKYENQ
jgi:hypothetical protein